MCTTAAASCNPRIASLLGSTCYFCHWPSNLHFCLHPGLSHLFLSSPSMGGLHFLLSSSFRDGPLVELLVHPFKFFKVYYPIFWEDRSVPAEEQCCPSHIKFYQLQFSECSHARKWVVWEGHVILPGCHKRILTLSYRGHLPIIGISLLRA